MRDQEAIGDEAMSNRQTAAVSKSDHADSDGRPRPASIGCLEAYQES